MVHPFPSFSVMGSDRLPKLLCQWPGFSKLSLRDRFTSKKDASNEASLII
jgi:hypothetical protein